MRFRPNISITPYHANVKDPEFNVDFFKQFNVVLNGLDNLDARRHVNRLCLAADVPLVESGTTGFLGQVTSHFMRSSASLPQCQSCMTFSISLMIKFYLFHLFVIEYIYSL